MLTLDQIQDSQWQPVTQPTADGVLVWKVRLQDPAMALGVPWLIEAVILRASPTAAPDDEAAMLEAAAARRGRSETELEGERFAQLQQIACDVIFSVSDDGESWRDCRVVMDAAQAHDPGLDPETGEPLGLLVVPVAVLDRVTVQAVAFAALSRLEGAAQSAHRFRVLTGGQRGGSSRPDGAGLRDTSGGAAGDR